MLEPEEKAKLLVYGVRTNLRPLRVGGGGPTAGLGFKVLGSVVSAPVMRDYVESSPFRIVRDDGRWFLLKNEAVMGEIQLPHAKYYSIKIKGIPARKLVALDGIDTLVSALSRECVHWSFDAKCKFCSLQDGITNSIRKKDPETLAQAIKIAYEEDKNRHLTLTTGTTNIKDKGARELAHAVKKIKSETDIPIHVQIEPVEREFLELLYESGTDTIGIHIETFDEAIKAKITPAKPRIQEYIRSWDDAVDIFGEWNVSSWIITGLGESLASVVKGFLTMVQKTVYPVIAPYRPPLGNDIAGLKIQHQLKLIAELKNLVKDYSITLPSFSSGCPRCNGCSFSCELLH